MEEVSKVLELIENESTTHLNTTKAVLRGKIKAISAYITNTYKSQINNLILHFKLSKNKNKPNPKLEGEK
jgi:hypothetical protein